MRVYRCIKLQEVINKYKNIKNKMQINNNALNTHKYIDGKEYIHFFRYSDFAKYYFNIGKNGSYEKQNEQYILFMTANIPNDILEKYKGFGFYELKGEKFPIPEYAIPIEQFSPSYIIDITDKPLCIDIRKNENEEYKKYIELVKEIKKNNQDMNTIINFLLHNNFEELLGVNIDMRTEDEIKEEMDLLLSTISFPNNDDALEELPKR